MCHMLSIAKSGIPFDQWSDILQQYYLESWVNRFTLTRTYGLPSIENGRLSAFLEIDGNCDDAIAHANSMSGQYPFEVVTRWRVTGNIPVSMWNLTPRFLRPSRPLKAFYSIGIADGAEGYVGKNVNITFSNVYELICHQRLEYGGSLLEDVLHQGYIHWIAKPSGLHNLQQGLSAQRIFSTQAGVQFVVLHMEAES